VSLRFEIRHRTVYRYGETMSRGNTVTHLMPRSDGRQFVLRSEIAVEPEPDERFEFEDAFGNRVVQFVVATPHDRLAVVASSSVDVLPADPVVDQTPWDAPHVWSPQVAGYAAPSLFATPTRAVAEFADPSFTPGATIEVVARDLCFRIFSEFLFDPSFTEVATPLDEVLRGRRGVCQDFAHLFIASLRSHGLPARYVSGYVETVAPPGEPKLVGADASHAWCSVALGDGTWFDLDPTNNQAPPWRHVVAAYGRDYLDVSPVTGVVIGPVSTQDLSVEVDVTST
jgi:transglutaminase-like putative cysteine protease